MLRFIIRLVVDITETQRAGIEAVFICATCGSNHPAIQLGVVAHRHIKTALTGKQPALLLHRIVVAVHLIAADIQAARERSGAEGVTQATTDAVLRAVVVVAVLQAGYRQVTADICRHLMAADLRAGQRGISPTGDGDLMTGIHRRFILPGAVTFLMPFAAVGICRDADTGAAGAHPHADANTAAAAFVTTAGKLCILRRNEVHIPERLQRNILTGFKLAARDRDIAACCRNGEIIAGIQGTAGGGYLL